MPTINPQAVRGPVTAVPVVAGKGVRFVEDVENNRVVAEVDETVLWEGTVSTVNDTMSLSESANNFEYIQFFVSLTGGTEKGKSDAICSNDSSMQLVIPFTANTWLYSNVMLKITCNTGATVLTIAKNSGMHYQTGWTTNTNTGTITKIVGVNRIASA